MSAKISTTTNIQPVHDPFTHQVLGEVLSKVYQGENVQRHSFIAQGTDKEYSLGPTTDAFKFVDWPQVFSPILEAGYEIKKAVVSRGGLKMHATLYNPQGPTYDDPVAWDNETWGTSTGLQDSIIVTGGIRPGSGFHFRRGFFRQICTNGLVIETLGLGQAGFNHVNFDADRLASALFGKDVLVSGESVYGEAVGTLKGLKKAREVVQRVLENPEAVETMPSFVRELVSPITSLPSRFTTLASDQFEQMIQNSARKQVYELDIANAMTSAQNLMEKAPARLAFKLLPAQRSYTKLAGIFSL